MILINRGLEVRLKITPWLTLFLCLGLGFPWTPEVLAEAGAVSGTRWKVIQKDGVHWLMDPRGDLFYSKGVNFIDPGKDTHKSRQKQDYYWGNFFPSLEDWRKRTSHQLSAWGFNTRGGWSDPSHDLDLPLMVEIDLGRLSHFHWFDSFHPDIEARVVEWAGKLTDPYRNDPRLIGYFTDNEVGWWSSALFKWFMNKGWDNHTKRVLWQLLHDQYGGDWNRLLADWVVPEDVKSFEDVKRPDVELKLRPGGEGIRVVNRFMARVARQYYALMFRALRKAHPEALVLGDRLPLYYHQDAVLAIGDNVDVISSNYNVDVADGWVSPYYFEGLQRLSSKPVLVTEFFFAAMENRSGNRNETARNKHPKPGHLMTVQTQEERARGVATTVRRFARFPNVVGAHWFQYRDQPFGGREDGEDYNMGLIDTANRPYDEVTEAFRAANADIEIIRSQLARTGERRPSGILSPSTAEAAVEERISLHRAASPPNVSDQSLLDWDKERTRIAGVQAPEPYVPFGDLHLAWSPEGLYLATIANTHVDPGFLAYEGEFPASEAFQIHVSVEADRKGHHQTITMIPSPDPEQADGFSVRPRLVQSRPGRPIESIPTAGRVQRIQKSLPHMHVEAFLPAESLGVPSLRAGMELRLNIVVVNYFRELSMSWPGRVPLEQAASPDLMKPVVLKH